MTDDVQPLWHAATSVRFQPLCDAPQPCNTTRNEHGVTCETCRDKAKVVAAYKEKGKR